MQINLWILKSVPRNETYQTPIKTRAGRGHKTLFLLILLLQRIKHQLLLIYDYLNIN